MKKLFVVGLGPGKKELLTFEAYEALKNSENIYGYKVYGEIVRNIFPQKNIITNNMGGEKERCKLSFISADSEITTSIVCSGDAGVYGMASPILMLSEQYPDVEVVIISGVTSALSGASVLGAPIGHDFAVISLSDYLTPCMLIEKRLKLAALGDFCIVIYNPQSQHRKDYLKKACDVLLKYKKEDTVCGWVRNIGRNEMSYNILPLKDLWKEPLDMFCTVFIGNNMTIHKNGKMITPRGYKDM